MAEEEKTMTEEEVKASEEAAEEKTEEAAAEEAAPEDEDTQETSEDTQEASEDNDPEETGDKEKRSFFSRKDKKELAKKDEQINDLTDRLRRSMAEFDNYRKRTEKEKSAMYGMGVKAVVEKILPVIDNFERGLATVPEESGDDAFVTGMEAVYKQFMTTLEGLDIKPIEAVGQPFDPNLHNAVMHVEDESLGENIVAEEFQKGYIMGETVVRHSMVKVAN